MPKFDPAQEERAEKALAYFRTHPHEKLKDIATKFVVNYLLLWRRSRGRPNMSTKGGHNKALSSD